MKKLSIIAELYRHKLISRELLFELSEVIETNFLKKHRKRIENKLDVIKSLPPIYHIAAVDRFLHSKRKVSENAFFRGVDEYIIKELLLDCQLINVPAGEYIYQAKQPADAGRPA